jgi:hypothetical protein
MKKILILTLLLFTANLRWTTAQPATEEAVKAYQDAGKAYQEAALELQRIDLRAKKRAMIQKAVPFNEEQGRAFWPIYDNYEKELTKVNDVRLAMIQDYAKSYETMTDEKAAELIVRAMDFQDKRSVLRKNYMTELKNVLPPRMVARLLQLENQTDLLIDLQIASEVPLVK